MRCLAGLAFLALSAVPLAQAKDDPVQWSLALANGARQLAPGSTVTLDLKATIQPGWHLYSPTTPPGGPIITKIRLNPNPNVASYQVYRPQPVRKLDPNFNIDTETYTRDAIFLIRADVAKSASGTADVAAVVRYQACSDVKCLNPVQKTATAHLTFAAGAPAASSAIPAGYALVPAAAASPAPVNPASSAAAAQPSGTGFAFLLTAFGFGIAALFTPCVFPMIPITVSFFLNQNAATSAPAKRNGWLQALVFCVGIIVLFTGLGLLATAIAGPFGVVQLGSSPWVNGFIALVFFVFGLSLLGAFELRLPSGLLTRLNSASQGGGYGGSLLMGLTFSLTSFACIGPIVGPLLVASVQSKGAPLLGMVAFAAGLAAPFFLLALFPSYLQRLPRSGMWMVRVKIVLGFIVLAVMLKYLSNIDQVLQTHWLTRERFLAAWIVLFALPGLYLLGLIPMEGIKREDRLGVSRALLACLFLIFSLTLVPGLFGGRLGDLDAYIPESSGGGLNATGIQTEAGGTTTFKNALPAALAAARQQNKLVLIDFTGYACTNCHWMNANMFPRPEIQAAMKNLIRVDLYTDGTDAESQKNQELEDKKFNTASIPFYALVDPDQNVIATFPQLTRNPQEFLAFLESKPGQDRTATAMLR
ncbi:MAG TPA: cytochrome c biogenesis protein CcdA [Bryobacteraceae bacterium]|nr:cytochrome c biogenesis protein CcdA [Bryobacteraceae bacterium]